MMARSQSFALDGLLAVSTLGTLAVLGGLLACKLSAPKPIPLGKYEAEVTINASTPRFRQNVPVPAELTLLTIGTGTEPQVVIPLGVYLISSYCMGPIKRVNDKLVADTLTCKNDYAPACKYSVGHLVLTEKEDGTLESLPFLVQTDTVANGCSADYADRRQEYAPAKWKRASGSP